MENKAEKVLNVLYDISWIYQDKPIINSNVRSLDVQNIFTVSYVAFCFSERNAFIGWIFANFLIRSLCMKVSILKFSETDHPEKMKNEMEKFL